MKLASVRFDDMVTVPGGKVIGADMVGDACEATFRAADGWEISELREGVFSLRAQHMTEPHIVGGYGYGYVIALEPPTEPPQVASGAWAAQAKAKKR